MNATSYPSHRVRTCLAQETQSLTYASLRTTSLHLSTSFPPKQTPPPLHLPSTASYPPKPTPSYSSPFPPKHLPQPTFKGHSLSSLSLYSFLTLPKPLTSSVINELETKAAPRLTANEKLHNPHSGVHKALPERSTKLTTEDPNVQLNSVRGILNTPAHTGPTASATPTSNKRGETTNNEEDCQLTAEVLRKHTSTQDALLNINEKIYSGFDNKNITLLLLLDFSKAFDSVEHTRLLEKISNLGIATQWFQSYLANRSHAVRLENTISSPIQNDLGVTQGSILGPLLFSIFINDFPSMPSNTRISMYADDVQIAMTSAPAKLSQAKSNAEILLKHV
ncbi:Reverse transcriptase domain [Trinorchestia longiramus]|nr:Reverse transcriptase domain [Trinorchestia longiramus]